MANPNDWFLASAGRRTESNRVEILVDGATYFERLQLKLSAMSSRNDELYLAGWRISSEQLLRPNNPNSSIGEWCRVLVANHKKVRAMIYGSALQAGLGVLRIQIPAFPSKDNASFVDELNRAGGEAILDGRLALYGSQHQKFVIVRSETDGDCAFVGGIDFTFDRYDNASHSSPAGRQTEPPMPVRVPQGAWWNPLTWVTIANVDVSMPGWHDAQVLVEGPAVTDVWQCFKDRWNDANRHGFVGTPSPLGTTPKQRGGTGTHDVQVLQTIPCGGVFAHAPDGEQSVSQATLRAIRQASKFIYIEDQYFWPSPVSRALGEAAGRGVHIIVVFSRDFDVPVLGYVHKKMRAEALAAIESVDRSKLHAFYLERPADKKQIYVHSKLMIFDDLFALVGSANLNHRSHTNDTEMQLGIFDRRIRTVNINGVPSEVGNSIHDTRTEIWSEHLGVPEEAVSDALKGLSEWPQPGSSKGNVVAAATSGGTTTNIDLERVKADVVQLLEVLRQDPRFTFLAPVILGPVLGPLMSASVAGSIAVVQAMPDPLAFAKQFLNPQLIC